MGISGVTGGGADDARGRTVMGDDVLQAGVRPDKRPGAGGKETHAVRKRLTETFSEMIEDRKEEFYVKVKNGTMEPSIPIGAGTYTEKEWDKILKRFDAVQEALREAAGLETDEKKGRSKDSSKDEVTDEEADDVMDYLVYLVKNDVKKGEKDDEEEDGVDLLLAQYVTCTYPADDPEKEDDVYMIIYDSQGIRCLNKTTGQYEWSIKFSDESQWGSVKTMMSELAASDDLSTACQETFWREYLEGVPAGVGQVEGEGA